MELLKNINRVFFSHIEKTAGTTLHEIFRNNSFFHYVDSPYKFSKNINNQKCYLTANELYQLKRYLPRFRSFGGHSVRIFENYDQCFDGKVVGVTFLRDPLRRYFSHFSHHKYKKRINWSFDEVLLHSDFNNFMCKKICGEEDSQKAIDLIKEKNIFIGIVENFDESLLLLKDFLAKHEVYKNFKINYEILYVNKKNNYNKLLENYYDQIVNNNLEDMKLYNYFSNQQIKYIEDKIFKSRLYSFQSKTKNFRFNYIKMKSVRLYKTIYQKQIEKIVRDTSGLPLGG